METSAGFATPPLPFSATLVSTTEKVTERDRLVSLDVMRGFAVVGMIVVNTIAFSNSSYGYHPASLFLSHAVWAGFTFADFVFPAFILVCGLSIAMSLRDSTLEWHSVHRIVTRAVALFALGFVLTNLAWFAHAGEWRYLGVLQRIALCYFTTALLFLSCGPRARVILSLFILAFYWPLAGAPVPHEVTNLFVPGANFVSWIDRIVLGPHRLIGGPLGYDPEGVLSTLPAIAQCLLGASFGERFLKNRARTGALRELAAAGAGTLLIGLCWSPFFPVVKNIWTSSFVLVSSGLSVLLFCTLHWILDVRKFRFRGTAFLEAFGLNALFAYVIQELAQLLPAAGDMHAIGSASARMDMPGLAANLPVVAFILILWGPLEMMRRRRWIVKL